MGSRVKGKEETEETKKLRRRIAELESRVAELETREKIYKRTEKLMAAENAVTLILAESRTPAQVITRTLQAVCQCLDWELGDFWTVDSNANLLYYKELWYRPTVKAERFDLISKQYTFRSGIGLPGRVLATGKPSWIVDVVKDQNFPRAQFAAEAGLHSACGFPILLGNEILGVMEFFCSAIQEPDLELIQFMAGIGNRIGEFNWNHWHESMPIKEKHRSLNLYQV